MNLQETLLNKVQEDKLGHFYILETSLSGPKAHNELITFIHHFIRDYYQKIEGSKQTLAHLMDHPDVYVLGNLDEEETKPFTVEESEAFARFFEFRPLQGKRKFAIITEAHRINSIVANKWLKLFEEPHGQVTIFLLNPRRQKLLETIHSRAVHLRLSVKSQLHSPQVWDEFLSEIKDQTLSQFLENFSKGERDIQFWTNEWIHAESMKTEGAESKMALQDWIKKLSEMEVFHQPTATKWTLFYSYLTEHAIKRLSR